MEQGAWELRAKYNAKGKGEEHFLLRISNCEFTERKELSGKRKELRGKSKTFRIAKCFSDF